MTFEQAKRWAAQLGIRVPKTGNEELRQCWIDRVYQAGVTGKQEDIDEANRYAPKL
jgi:hypothetical protein